ncbi:MAG: magnesium transporter [Candidatus Bathyarchaeia archaeon]
MQKQAFKRVIKESAPALVVAALIDILAGTAMQLRGIEAWVAIPVFLMLVPSLSDLGNDVACIISSRITTLLALGVIHPKWGRNEALEANIAAIVTVGILSSAYLGIINFAIAGFGSVQILPFLAVCVIAVTVLTLLVCVVAIGIAFIAWRRGLDPDNVTIPISTSISDLLGIFSLLIAIRMVGFI